MDTMLPMLLPTPECGEEHKGIETPNYMKRHKTGMYEGIEINGISKKESNFLEFQQF